MLWECLFQIANMLPALISGKTGKRGTARRAMLPISIAALCVNLFSVGAPANAATLFDNPFDPSAKQTFWCDPCSSGNVGYRVWDSFTLMQDSTLTSLHWLGLRTDIMSLGVNVEIAIKPYGADLFSAHYTSASIARFNTGVSSSARTVSLPDLVLASGVYWLTVYGPSISEQHTWLGSEEVKGDNSLIQFGPDPTNPKLALPRFQDARFQLDGYVSTTPLPGALPLFGAGIGLMALLQWRRKRRLEQG